RADAQTQRANKERERAMALERWRQTAYYRQDVLAFRDYHDNHLAQAEDMLDQYDPAIHPQPPEEPDLRNWEWRYLKRLCHSEISSFSVRTPGSGEPPQWAALSHDGARVAVYDGKGFLHLRDTATGKEEFTFRVRGDIFINQLAFSPDGKRLCLS